MSRNLKEESSSQAEREAAKAKNQSFFDTASQIADAIYCAGEVGSNLILKQADLILQTRFALRRAWSHSIKASSSEVPQGSAPEARLFEIQDPLGDPGPEGEQSAEGQS